MATIVARKRAGGVRYTAQIRIARGGKVVFTESETFDKRSLARAWADRREAELKAPGALERLQHRGITVGQVLTWYRDDFDGLSKFGRTKLSSVNFLIDYASLAELDALELTAAQLVAHVRERRRGGAGPSTVMNDLIWLRGAFRAARIGRGLPLELGPIDDAVYLCRREKLIARSGQRDRRPTVAEVDALMAFYSPGRRKQQLPMRDIILFAMFSARRQDEIFSLRWDDFDAVNSCVLVREMKHPRLKIDTWVDLPAPAVAVILRQPRVDERIFPYVAKSVGGSFSRACGVIGIDDLRFHDLRHECASWLFELGWDIPRVARVTGHRSWATLQRYTHIQTNQQVDKWAGWRWLPVA